MCKTIGKSILLLLAGILMGTVLLWASYLLPISADHARVAESTEILEQEGWYPTAPLMRRYDNEPMGRNGGGIMDNYTDAIMISTAAYRPVEGALYQTMNMASGVIESGYSYYWHGYVPILRPLLLFVNYADIRVLNQLLQMMLITFMTCVVYRKKGAAYAALPFTIYGLLMPMAVSQSLQYSWVFYIGMGGSLAVVQFHDSLRKGQRIGFFFLVLGMLTSYMDLLTYPLFTWGIPMIWWIVMDDEAECAKRQLQQVVLCGIHWIFGYGGLWVGKWIVGGMVTGKPVVMQAWNEILYRGGRIENKAGRLAAYWNNLLFNLQVCINVQVAFLLGLWFAWWCYKIAKGFYKAEKEKTLALLLIALSPFVWYLVLENHTYLHSNFAYRIYVIGGAALLASMIHSWKAGEEGQPRAKSRRIVPVLMLLTAILTALSLKDERHIHNGGSVTPLALEEQVEWVQDFSPVYDRIEYINLYLTAENGTSGKVDVKLLNENGKPIWEREVAAKEIWGLERFCELPVQLRLDQEKTYQISVSASGLEGNHLWIGVAGIGQYPLAELPSLQVGGQKFDTQLTFGAYYRYRANLFRILFAAELQMLIYWNLYLLVSVVLTWLVRDKSGMSAEKEDARKMEHKIVEHP